MLQKRLFLAAVLTVASTFATWAQTVQGTITDATSGESIIGATVKYGDGKGVTTDIDGQCKAKEYSILLHRTVRCFCPRRHCHRS